MQIKWFENIDSTNLEANRNLSFLEDLSVIAAKNQTAGRGQRGNKWKSASSLNLTFSVLIKPSNLLAINQFAISQISSLAVLDYLSIYGVHAKIKWPNDIYVGDLKICGILIENKLHADKVSASVIGIGININQNFFENDIPNPTSLVLELFRNKANGIIPEFNLCSELEKFMNCFESLYTEYISNLALCFNNLSRLNDIYHKNLYRLNEIHSFYDKRESNNLEPNNPLFSSAADSSKIFEAKILGVNPKNSCLILEFSSGDKAEFSFKEVSFVVLR